MLLGILCLKSGSREGSAQVFISRSSADPSCNPSPWDHVTHVQNGSSFLSYSFLHNLRDPEVYFHSNSKSCQVDSEDWQSQTRGGKSFLTLGLILRLCDSVNPLLVFQTPLSLCIWRITSCCYLLGRGVHKSFPDTGLTHSACPFVLSILERASLIPGSDLSLSFINLYHS